MRLVIQRVRQAQVAIEQHIVSQINQGLLLFIGIEHRDTEEDASWLAQKVVNMRIFSDEEGKMNKSLLDCQGQLLVVSQFTLHASTKKGNRPSFINAAPPTIAIPLYEKFLQKLQQHTGNTPACGKFGADMQISLLNDGPVTITIDSQNRE